VSRILPEECDKGDEKFQSRCSEFRPRFEKRKRYPLSRETGEWEMKRVGYVVCAGKKTQGS